MANTNIYYALENLENFFQNSLELVTRLQAYEDHTVEDLKQLRQVLIDAMQLLPDCKPSLALATSQATMRVQKEYSNRIRAEKRANKILVTTKQ